MKRDKDATGISECASGGHMSSTEGLVVHVPGAELPYVVILEHHRTEFSEHALGEAFKGRLVHQNASLIGFEPKDDAEAFSREFT